MAKVTRETFIDTVLTVNDTLVSAEKNRNAIIALGDIVNYVSSLERALDKSDGWVHMH